MKTFLFWSFLICFSFSSRAQTYSSSCIPSGTMEVIYHNDACRLAIKRMHDIASPFADSTTIPEIFIDSIEKALYAVVNIQNALVGDTIKELFGYTNFSFPGLDSTHFISASTDNKDAFALKQIKVIVDNNITWGSQWLSGNYNTTSNDSVNYLINKHNLQVSRNADAIGPTSTVYTISSPLAINAGALARQFEKFSGVGVGKAYALPFLSFNNNIVQAEFIDNSIQLTYSYGCGDCPSGCTMERIWKFKVHSGTDCSVDYLSVENWGSPTEWLSNPCLDYLQTSKLCPSTNATSFYAFPGVSDTPQWQVSTDGISFTNIADDANYKGTNTATLQLNNLPSSWYANNYRCLINGNKGKVTYRITFVNNWNSTSETAWENAANWSCGTLPDNNTDVVIKTGTLFLNSDATVRSLTVTEGATFNIAPGRHLTVLH
jgi:hypothetical protein